MNAAEMAKQVYAILNIGGAVKLPNSTIAVLQERFEAYAASETARAEQLEAENSELRRAIAHKDNYFTNAALEVVNANERADRAEQDAKELEALRSGARTGLLKFMLAGDVGCFADKMRQLIQANDWDGMRLTVTDFFNAARDVTQMGREEMDRLEAEIQRKDEALRGTLAQVDTMLAGSHEWAWRERFVHIKGLTESALAPISGPATKEI